VGRPDGRGVTDHDEWDDQPRELHLWNRTVEQVGVWYDAVELQAERVRTAVGGGENPTAAVTDVVFLIDAMHRLHRACAWSAERFEAGSRRRQRVDAATAGFATAHPHLQPLRHGFEHFNNWIEGTGVRQPKPTRSRRPFRPKLEYGRSRDGTVTDFVVHRDDLSLDVIAAAAAALAMGREVNAVFNEKLDDRCGIA